MKIIVASANPVKITSAKNAFSRAFPDVSWEVEGMEAVSGVPDQPMTFAETVRGAENRVKYIFERTSSADFWVAFEGGLEEVRGHLESVAYVVVQNKERMSIAHTASFRLPTEIEQLVREGKELGHASDIVFQRHDSKKGIGTVGILTNDLINRVEYYEHACVLALAPFLHPELYPL